MIHKVIIGLGSNSNAERNISLTRQILIDIFDNIYFAKPVTTKPINFPNPDLFLNQVGIFKTTLNVQEITSILKQIEQTIGRTPEDKLKHRVTIDADLIQWDDEILKPEDIKRTYIQDALQEIKDKYHLSL